VCRRLDVATEVLFDLKLLAEIANKHCKATTSQGAAHNKHSSPGAATHQYFINIHSYQLPDRNKQLCYRTEAA